jgi:riboflavin synthase
MFSGLVEETGVVQSVQPRSNGIALAVRAKLCARRVKAGDSVAVNGCCLTVEKITRRGAAGLLQFSLLEESWRRTNLQHVQPGAAVNLERALRVGDSLGGHFVTGHIDGMGKITRWEREGRDHVLEINAPASLLRQMALKGSIAVDGISLTVAALTKKTFRVWIIPHTYERTALRERKTGGWVNLETDLLGKHVERILSAR